MRRTDTTTVIAALAVVIAAAATLVNDRRERAGAAPAAPPAAAVAAAVARRETWQRQLDTVEEGNTLVLAFAVAVALMYLVLAAQFNSLRDPGIMLVSVPMSLAGALIFFALGVVTVNIYTQIGLLALIGSIIRHGILLVEFANNVQQNEKLERVAAMRRAARLRLRPILMTTIATLAGMVPLLFAIGPGAESRFAIGLVLGAGMAIGTVFTLFVVPALYTVVARRRDNEALAVGL